MGGDVTAPGLAQSAHTALYCISAVAGMATPLVGVAPIFALSFAGFGYGEEKFCVLKATVFKH